MGERGLLSVGLAKADTWLLCCVGGGVKESENTRRDLALALENENSRAIKSKANTQNLVGLATTTTVENGVQNWKCNGTFLVHNLGAAWENIRAIRVQSSEKTSTRWRAMNLM